MAFIRDFDKHHDVLLLTSEDVCKGLQLRVPPSRQVPGSYIIEAGKKLVCQNFAPNYGYLTSLPGQVAAGSALAATHTVATPLTVPVGYPLELLGKKWLPTGAGVVPTSTLFGATTSTVAFYSVSYPTWLTFPIIYNLGSVVTVSGDRTVTGTGTLWLKQALLTAGTFSAVAVIGGGAGTHAVATVDTDTSIELATVASADNPAGATCSLYIYKAATTPTTWGKVRTSHIDFTGSYIGAVVYSYGLLAPCSGLFAKSSTYYHWVLSTVAFSTIAANDCIVYAGRLVFISPYRCTAAGTVTQYLNGLSWWDYEALDDTISAGDKILDVNGIAYCAEIFGGDLYIYTSTGIWRCTQTGNSDIFNFEKITSQIRATGRFCVADCGKFHVVAGSGRVWIFDGTANVQEVSETQIGRFADGTEQIVEYDPVSNCVFVTSFTADTALTAAIFYKWDLVTNSWSTLILSGTAVAQSSISYCSYPGETFLTKASDRTIYKWTPGWAENEGALGTGASIPVNTLTFDDLQVDPTIYERIDRIEFFIKATKTTVIPTQPIYYDPTVMALAIQHSTDYGVTFSTAQNFALSLTTNYTGTGTPKFETITAINKIVYYINTMSTSLQLKLTMLRDVNYLVGLMFGIVEMQVYLKRREPRKY